MVEGVSSPSFEDIDLSNPWGELEFKEKGTSTEPETAEFYTHFLRLRTQEEALSDLHNTDYFVLKNHKNEVIALALFRAQMSHRKFDDYKNFSLGDIMVASASQKQGIASFLAHKAIEFFDTQDTQAPINFSIGSEAGRKLAAKIKEEIGNRLNVF